MKVLKFLLLTAIFVLITSIVPIKLFNITSDMTKFNVQVEGSAITGILGYQNKISLNPDISKEVKDDTSEMVLLSNKMLEYKNSTYNNLVAYLVVIQNIILIFLGIILKKKTDHKLVGNSIITAGIISLIILLGMSIIIAKNVVIL